MDKKAIITISQRAKQKLLENLTIEQLIVFGSQVTGKAKQYSDIDIAVISNDFGKDYWEEEKQVSQIVKSIDSRFEVHVFNPGDFSNTLDPLVSEIHKFGVTV